VRRSLLSLDAIFAGRNVAFVYSNTLSVMAGALWAWRRHLKHVWHVHEILLSPRMAGSIFSFLLDKLSDRIIFISTAVESWILGKRPRIGTKSSLVFNGLPELRHDSPR